MRVWGITSGQAGMVAQVRALAQALEVVPQMKRIDIRAPFSLLPNIVFASPLRKVVLPCLTGDALCAPYPELVISCGRRGALAAMGMREMLLSPPPAGGRVRVGDFVGRPSPEAPSPALPPAGGGGRTVFIHIQDPQLPARYFDLVVAMRHDRITGPNVIKTRYALHAITPQALARARAEFEPVFAAYQGPRVAVLLGGSTNKYRLGADGMRGVIASLKALLAQSAGSLLITPSRRTGQENIRMLREAFSGDGRVYIYDFAGANPYMGLLAVADAIVATDDSVNMMSEAVATGKPVYILKLPGHAHTKPADFALGLLQEGAAREMDGRLEQWEYAVGDEMGWLAGEVRGRLG